MDITILVRAGMVLAAVGLFIASYYRFSNPVRLEYSRERRAPQVPARGSALPGQVEDDRRTPSV